MGTEFISLVTFLSSLIIRGYNHVSRKQRKNTEMSKKIRKLTKIVHVEGHLKHAKSSTGEVQQNVADTPPLRAFSDKVHVGLGDVLDGSYHQFDV